MATASERHLQKFFEFERATGVRRMAVVRLAVSTALLVLALVFGGDLTRAVLPLAAYTGIASVLVWNSRRQDQKATGADYSLALLDVPVVVIVLSLTTNSGGDPRFDYTTGAGVLGALVAASAISLSRQSVALTCTAAIACSWGLYWFAHAPLVEYLLVSLPLLTIAAFSAFTVGRVRALVVASRKDDLVGKYLLGPRLGVGGMAEVFKATYSPEGGFEREVAIKRILPAFAQDPTFVTRFRREAEITSRLVHPNVVQVLDFGQVGGTYFLAMEFVDGVPLSRLRRERLPVAAVTYLALELGAALDFIHHRTGTDGQPLGLVHRDVNPPNVLLSRHGEVKLADFGVVRALGHPQATATGILIGKLRYVAPEQVLGETYDGRADLFALGLTLYELLVGHRAFDSADETSYLRNVLTTDVPSVCAEFPEIPAAVGEIVAGLVCREPGKRTASGALLREQVLALSGEAAALPVGRAALVERVLAEASGDLPVLPPITHEGRTVTVIPR